MKRKLTHIAGIIGLVVGSIASSSVSAQTTANGPYYATPSWDQTLPSNTRFIVLSNFALQAVLDRDTGLVWERSPSTDIASWGESRDACIDKNVGGRKGWRLPSIQELASLVDPSVLPPGPTLPVGHPFIGVASVTYHSATTVASRQGPGSLADDRPTSAWRVSFQNGVVLPVDKDDNRRFWCVRGGGVLDNY